MAQVLLDMFQAWVKQHTQIQWAPTVKGGWERWAQVDFNNFLRTNMFAVMTELEDYVYTSGEKDDITVGEVNVGGNKFPGGVMELKVLNRDESLNDFVKKIGVDVKTLQGTMKPLYTAYVKCSFALATGDQLLALLRNASKNNAIDYTNFQPVLKNYINTHQIVVLTSNTPTKDKFVLLYLM